MDIIYNSCCGLDVHKKVLVAWVKNGPGKGDFRKFGTTTDEILAMATWLKSNDCEMVAMESTGSYWKPVYNILEECGMPAMVVNAAHMKNVPGRKTDVTDAEWICDLVKHGLLTASFIPDRQLRELREVATYRKKLVGERTAELNRFQKVMEGANIKLSGTISTIDSKTGMALINALLEGDDLTADTIAQMRKDKVIGHVKATDAELAAALKGSVSSIQKGLLTEIQSHLKDLNERIERIDGLIDVSMTDEQKAAAEKLCQIPGIGETAARTIICVIGCDLDRFPNDNCFAKWAGLCPGNNESAGKRYSGRTTKGNPLLKTTMVNCAHAAVKCRDSYYYAQYNRIAARRGKKRAIVAVAHSMLRAIYHMIQNDVDYVELGADYFNKFNVDKKINSYLKRLSELGCTAEQAMEMLKTEAAQEEVEQDVA